MQITLYNHAGERQTRGGELLRVILGGVDANKSFSTGYVQDNQNGTYTAELEALWTGRSTITADVLYSRQSIAAMYRMRREVYII